MAGKPYSISEMKIIVDYLVEQKAYNELKGRKRWMDLANSQMTTRTWQSLKETFLKRILPDIHNPYYKLSMTQIRSFKDGRDVSAVPNNKLKIVTEDSSETAKSKKENEPSSTTKSDKENSEEPSAGEDKKCSKITSHNRASVETLVIELEDEDSNHANDNTKSDTDNKIKSNHDNDNNTKSLRDRIVYTEPLTPILQGVLDDFNTDDEEGQLQIDENATNGNFESNGSKQLEAVTNSRGENNNNTSKVQLESVNGKTEEPDATANDTNDKENTNDDTNDKENTNDDTYDKNTNKNTDNSISEIKTVNNQQKQPLEANIPKPTEIEKRSSLGTSQSQQTNTSTDLTLPNNQELLAQNEKLKDIQFTETQKNEETNNVGKRGRRRTISKNIDNNNSTIGRRRISSKSVDSNVANPTSSIPKKSIDQKEVKSLNEERENPCLKSVSLFEEQFSAPNLLDSDSSEAEINENNKAPTAVKELPKIKVDATKEVVLLNSHSDSDSEPPPKLTRTAVNRTRTISKSRNKALANLLGFSSGGVQRKRGIRRRSSNHHQMQDIVVSDSEWTSESDSDIVPPPRARGHRSNKKYIKPGSARIMSLEEEGGLFIVHNRKVYPLVKDGKIVKNYVNFIDEQEDNEEDSYWKLKYAQEKKKTAELSKLLQNRPALLPNLQDTRPEAKQSEKKTAISEPEDDVKKNDSVQSDKAVCQKEELPPQPERSIKIKFCGNDKEVQLEGHWTNIQPVLEQVVHIFQKEPIKNNLNTEKNHLHVESHPKPGSEESETKNKSPNVEDKEELVLIDIDENSRESEKRNIDEIEKSIFKEIVELSANEDLNKKQSNVTRGRSKRINQDVQPSSSKKSRITENNALSTKVLPRRTRTPSRKKKEKETLPSKAEAIESDDSELVFYRLPSPETVTNKSRVASRSKSRNRYTEMVKKVFSSPENKSMHSESTQGYQDSDISPIGQQFRRKRKHSFSSLKTLPVKHKAKQFTRTRSHPNLYIDDSSDSSNSSVYNIPFKTAVFRNSSINSDIYRSESYQLLMHKPKPCRPLESIDENQPIETNVTNSNLPSEDGDKPDAASYKGLDILTISINNDAANSSNVSFPVSPELSIVEKLSVNKSLLSSDIDFPTINEIQNNEPEHNLNDNYLMSQVDASIPLMQQVCGFQIQSNSNETPGAKPITDSLLNKISTVKLEDINSPSNSLHEKLRHLILNSAKKLINEMSIDASQKDQAMEVDSSKTEAKKVGARKRSSTPRKKSATQKKAKPKKSTPVIEERVEYCSNGGRNSCPPSVLAPITNIDLNRETDTTPKTKSRRKKDVIKVKIIRPKSRTPKKRNTENTKDVASSNRSVETSAGTNESGIFIQTVNDSIDLIHNHSETCLHAHDCIDSSVELLSAAKSTITVDSDSNHISEYFEDVLAEFDIPEMYCNNARDATCYKKSTSKEPDSLNTQSDPVAVYHSPIPSDLSLITEDLSDEILTPPNKPTKWYLLNEDETTKSTLPQFRGSLTGNLNQIFPIVCAVPNLSTITEISKDGDSRKKTFDSNDNTENHDTTKLISNSNL